MQTIDTRRPARNDTFDLRGQLLSDDQMMEAHGDTANYAGTDDEEHSVLEDDSDGEERDDYMDEDDDGSSSLSIPNESIDFDLVYSLHSFAATVEGQANVVKGDSLFLMDDSNSYWWLVRVLKTQEVGYIPAENIETPFERLARLNKHRNVDLASATQAELQDGLNATQDRLRNNLNSRQGQTQSPSPIPNRSRSRQTKSVIFTPSMTVHRYPPAVWHSEDEDEDGEDVEWDDEGYEGEDPDLAAEAEEMEHQRRLEESMGMGGPAGMEMDDGVAWDDAAAKEMQQARQAAGAKTDLPASLRPGAGVADQQALQAQQQQQQQVQIQQQKQRELAAQQQQQAQQQQNISPEQRTVRPSNSRERLAGASPAPQDSPSSTSSAGQQRRMDSLDPLDRQETVRMTMTPTIAREIDEGVSASQIQAQMQAQAQVQKQEEERKRIKEEDSEDSLRKKAKGKDKMGAPVSSASYATGSGGGSSGAKLRKEREPESEDSKDKKKKGGVFGGLFGRRKDKDKKEKNGSISSFDVSDGNRASEESSRTGSRPSNGSGSIADGMISPTTQIAMQQQQQQQATALRNSMDPRRLAQQNQGSPQGPGQQTPATPPHQVSQHASQLRQKDQQQQALYQQYLNRSPSSPPELQPSYGLQSASAINNSYNHSSGSGLGPPTHRPRPGSLILTPGLDGSGPLPELSVIRVFAGDNLQTDATFKTVLLNSSTTSADLVRQALQRFRLPGSGSADAEDAGEYYLTVKQVEGSSAMLRDTEKPLVVFEKLVEEANKELELPKVKRSSVGSISSVSSNLSMHPAIRKLPMNDFTDDSAVKIYLNRKGVSDAERSFVEERDETLIAADVSVTESESGGIASPRAGNFLTVLTSSGDDVSPERFSSPSFRFALQLVIYADDLPDDMVFDPLTEAIVFKDTLKERDRSSGGHNVLAGSSGSVSQKLRKKVFVFPKNVTVAEVIELGLERFGILEGVVDGGDEVEDKLAKRRSSSRVRYGLSVSVDAGQEKELSPSSKVIEAFPRPPTFRAVDRRFADTKRRSVDSTQLLGTLDDVTSSDPTFILRRATSYRNSTSRHRMSAPLDEIALRSLHRESASSAGSEPLSPNVHDESFASKQKAQQPGPSRKEIIAAQREASRANQRAILQTQTNSVRGVDVLLPGNVRLRSSRYTTDDKMRYSYVQPDGESYDISDIIEEEWKKDGAKGDLLEGVVGRGGRDAVGNVGEKLDKVLNKIKDGKGNGSLAPAYQQRNPNRVSPVSEYSVDETVEAEPTRSRSVTPVGARPMGQSQTLAGRVASPTSTVGRSTPDDYRQQSRPGTMTPTAGRSSSARRNPSIASVMSDFSGYETAGTHPATETRGPTPQTPASPPQTKQQPNQNIPPKRMHIPKDDFGVSHMLAVIEYRAMKTKPKSGVAEIKREVDEVEEMLFGKKVDLASLHPKIRDVYADSFKKMDEMDEILDDYLQRALREKA